MRVITFHFCSQDEDDENVEEAPLTEKPVEPTTGSTGSTKSPTRRSAPEAQRQNSVKPLADDKVSRAPSCVTSLMFAHQQLKSHNMSS